MQAAIQPIRYARQASNEKFANDGSLVSVERLVEKLTFKFHQRVAKLGLSMNEDDVRQEILMAYVKAQKAWNPDGGARFATYFQTTAQNEFNRRIERAAMDRTTLGLVSYHDVVAGSTDGESGDPLEFMGGEDLHESPEDAIGNQQEHQNRLRANLESLTPEARKLMVHLIRDERTPSKDKPPRLRDIARRLNMPLDEIKRVKLELLNRFGTTFV